MREIKFRAWEPDAKEMVYFDNLKASKDPYIASHLCALMANEHPKGSGLLMQFTGLYDCNGVEIYEGDILSLKWVQEDPYVGKVRFNDGAFTLCCANQNIDIVSHLCETYTSHSKVIGNIHQHKHLLDGAIED